MPEAVGLAALVLLMSLLTDLHLPFQTISFSYTCKQMFFSSVEAVVAKDGGGRTH